MGGVNEWIGFAEPTLADVQREFSGWEAWRGTSARCYARLARPQAQRAVVEGEDPRDLRDSIIRWLGLNDEEDAKERYLASGQWPSAITVPEDRSRLLVPWMRRLYPVPDVSRKHT